MDPLVSTIQGFPLVTTVLSYYDTGDIDLRADDRQAVLIVVRSEDPTVSHNGDIDVQPMLDEVDKANTSTPGFEVGIISSRIIEDQFEDIIAKDFQRILLVSMFFGLGVLILAFRAVVAALIPLVMAIVAIFTALGIMAVISQKFAFAESYAEVLLLMVLR